MATSWAMVQPILQCLVLLLICAVNTSQSSAGTFTKYLNFKMGNLEDIRGLRPVNLTAHNILQDLSSKAFHLEIQVTRQNISVIRDKKYKLYESVGEQRPGFMSHDGMHVLVLHPLRGELMLGRQFLTHQPAEHRNLVDCLKNIQPGRIIIVVAVPDAITFMSEESLSSLEKLGSVFIRKLATFESWVFVTHTAASQDKSRVLVEAIITRRPRVASAPLLVHLTLPKIDAIKCSWHEDADLQDQHLFCDRYEGYGRLCTCNSPITRELRHQAPTISMKEVIPVAMLTAVKPFNFYRQLVNLLQTPGGSQTPILVLVDGPNMEIIQLVGLFRLPMLIHSPQGEKSSNTLLNMHFRFSVYSIFDYFPDVDKAIILEDDLLLSPDFFRFFQQTAWLLDADPTIYCVNAFSVNSYPTVASDPQLLRRVDIFPQFGWMINRQWVKRQLPLWVSEKDGADWDWWLSTESVRQQRKVLVPEVGRTYHLGAAGAHVNGWGQEHHFSNMIYNQDPHVNLTNLDNLVKDRYEAWMRKEILTAKEHKSKKSPCDDDYIPKNETGPLKVFVSAKSLSDESLSFYVMAQCLHAWSDDTRDNYNGVVMYNVHGVRLFIVGCPLSYFCSMFPEGVSTITASDSLIDIAEKHAYDYGSINYQPTYPYRRSPKSLEEEFNLENKDDIPFTNHGTIRKKNSTLVIDTL